MHPTGLDLFFWAAGFLENLGLLLVLWYRRRARSFPFFTALITLIVLKTMVLYLVLHYGTKDWYFYTYWSLTVLDTILQLCVVYEIASRVFRPLDVWGKRRTKQFPLAAELECMRGFWSDLAGKSAGANLDAGFRDQGQPVCSRPAERTFRRHDGALYQREASMENACGQDCPGIGRLFAARGVDRDRTQLLWGRPGAARLYRFVPCSYGGIFGLRYLLDNQFVA
jgi:hypothetical protein